MLSLGFYRNFGLGLGLGLGIAQSGLGLGLGLGLEWWSKRFLLKRDILRSRAVKCCGC